jgi:hypothetical protein
MSIFGAFNIVKETKELEALQKQDNTKQVDFEQDARETQQPAKGGDKNSSAGLYSNPKTAQTYVLLRVNFYVLVCLLVLVCL